MKKLFTLLALAFAFSMNAQMSDNSSGTSATGIFSVAMGWNTLASGNWGSTAMGEGGIASGSASTAMGRNTTASGHYSTAMGRNTTASGNYATAMGYYTEASGGYGATAMGTSTTASGTSSTVMGDSTTASGDASTAMGRGTIASDYASLVIGQYNDSGSSVTSDATAFSTSNTAFVIGNGTPGSESDAFKVMFSGDATVSNDLTVSGDVNVSSDARLKSNIVSLGPTLSKLLLIDGKSYTMNKDGEEKIGVLAQDIQKVFPKLVGTDDNDMLTVNYQGLVPVLINALKEQELKINLYDRKIADQQKEIDELKELFNKILKK